MAKLAIICEIASPTAKFVLRIGHSHPDAIILGFPSVNAGITVCVRDCARAFQPAFFACASSTGMQEFPQTETSPIRGDCLSSWQTRASACHRAGQAHPSPTPAFRGQLARDSTASPMCEAAHPFSCVQTDMSQDSMRIRHKADKTEARASNIRPSTALTDYNNTTCARHWSSSTT